MCSSNVVSLSLLVWQRYYVLHLNSVTAKDGHDRPLLDKLLWCLVSSPIFVCCQRLIARKIAELFSTNRAVSQLYQAWGIDDVSRGSVLCLFAASFGGAIFTATTLNVCAKTNDPGGRRGNTVWIVARWRRPVATTVFQDILHWAMCSVLQPWITEAIKTASKCTTIVANMRAQFKQQIEVATNKLITCLTALPLCPMVADMWPFFCWALC